MVGGNLNSVGSYYYKEGGISKYRLVKTGDGINLILLNSEIIIIILE